MYLLNYFRTNNFKLLNFKLFKDFKILLILKKLTYLNHFLSGIVCLYMILASLNHFKSFFLK